MKYINVFIYGVQKLVSRCCIFFASNGRLFAIDNKEIK
jgi:hypothetical protein